MNFTKICVIGLGYIGLPTASTFATNGIKVIGVDVNQRVVQTLQNGEIHIHEPGLRTLVQAATKSGNLEISAHPEEADAFIIAVPTPLANNKKSDLSYVWQAGKAVAKKLKSGCCVILESTVPVGTTEKLAQLLEEQRQTR